MKNVDTICYRLSTMGAKTSAPVFLGQRLKNVGNPVQQQREWGKERGLLRIENHQIPISGIVFRFKIAVDMKVTLYVTVVLATLVVVCHGDTYLQNPRGSNNRLNENTANRRNANRLFDSQNNNKGGYNTGDGGHAAAGNRAQRQYSMGDAGHSAAGNWAQMQRDSQALASKVERLPVRRRYLGCAVVLPEASQPCLPKLVNHAAFPYYLVGKHYGSGEDAAKIQSDPDLPGPDLPEPRFTGRVNFPQNRKFTKYYGSGEDAASKLIVEWTNQHGCGGNSKLNCNIVIQYMCMNNGTDEDYPYDRSSKSDAVLKRVMYMKDGVSTNTQNSLFRSRDWLLANLQNHDEDLQRTPWIDAAWLGDVNKCDYIKKNSFNNNAKYRCVLSTESDERKYGRSIDEDSCDDEGGEWVKFNSFIEVLTDVTSESDTPKEANKIAQNTEKPNSLFRSRDWLLANQRPVYWNHDEDLQRTPWIDAAWLGDVNKCDYIKKNSFNNNAKYRCVLSTESDERKYGRSIDEDSCDDEGGEWVKFNSFIEVLTDVTSESDCEKAAEKQGANKIVWDKLRSDDRYSQCFVQAPTLECREAPWSRVNHLGNHDNPPSGNADNHDNPPSGNAGNHDKPSPSSGNAGNHDNLPSGNADNYDGESHPNASRIELDLPYFPSGDAKRCVMRLRYNISTTDYDGWNTFADSNDDDHQTARAIFHSLINPFPIVTTTRFLSDVIENDPEVDVFGDGDGFELALNTAQTGRTFQDRSHVYQSQILHPFPGTDRSNMLEMSDQSENYPKTIKEAQFWDGVKSLTDPDASGTDIAIGLASAGYYCFM
eukprot:sb/3462116/